MRYRKDWKSVGSGASGDLTLEPVSRAVLFNLSFSASAVEDNIRLGTFSFLHCLLGEPLKVGRNCLERGMKRDRMLEKVAIIGAGAAGLAACRHLKRDFQVTVFESHSVVGGTWAVGRPDSALYQRLRTNLPKEIMGFFDYEFTTERCVPQDCLKPPGGERNESMTGASSSNQTPSSRSFVSAESVQQYLCDYAAHHDLHEHMKFHCQIARIEPLRKITCSVSKARRHDIQQHRWKLHWTERALHYSEVFDYLVVCNGHFNERLYPSFVNQAIATHAWKGAVIHSKDYDAGDMFCYRDDANKLVTDSFKGKVVTVVGFKSSGSDICMNLASVAKEVHVCDANLSQEILEDFLSKQQPGLASGLLQQPSNLERGKCFWHGRLVDLLPGSTTVQVEKVSTDAKPGAVASEVIEFHTDVLIFATGYGYAYDFFQGMLPGSSQQGILENEGSAQLVQDCDALASQLVKNEKRVSELFRQIQHRQFPSLFFLGLQFGVIPFPLFDIQSKWVLHRIQCLKGDRANSYFPTPEEDECSADIHLAKFGNSHSMGGEASMRKQFRFWEVLLEDVGIEEDYYRKERKYREIIYNEVNRTRPSYPGERDTYRDIDYPDCHEFYSKV